MPSRSPNSLRRRAGPRGSALVSHPGPPGARPDQGRLQGIMRTVRLFLQYRGTGYHGWQIQPNILTVQGVLEEALARLLGGPVRVTGASRTDAGVHALRQVASFPTERLLPPDAIRSALNAMVPRDIRVLDASDAPPGFNARRRARSKSYGYLILNTPIPSPFWLDYAWHLGPPLDVEAMRSALSALRGTHDFSSFRAADGGEKDPVRTVYSCKVRRHRGMVAVFVSADSFLHHMVRNIVGSLVEVGRGARRPEWIARVLEAKDRRLAGPTAPAQGLWLLRVRY